MVIRGAPAAINPMATYCMEPAYINRLIANANRIPYPLALSIIPNPNPSTRYPVSTGSVAIKADLKVFFILVLQKFYYKWPGAANTTSGLSEFV